MRSGRGFAPDRQVTVRLQNGDAAIVHRKHHSRGAALFRNALYYSSGAIQAESETA
jgi:hypothetical protein